MLLGAFRAIRCTYELEIFIVDHKAFSHCHETATDEPALQITDFQHMMSFCLNCRLCVRCAESVPLFGKVHFQSGPPSKGGQFWDRSTLRTTLQTHQKRVPRNCTDDLSHRDTNMYPCFALEMPFFTFCRVLRSGTRKLARH
jgi:hypothetical protein